MTEIDAAVRAGPAPWTCPFCPLLCDGFGVSAEADAWVLKGSDCARARAALQRFEVAPSALAPRVDGQPGSLDAAVAAAAAHLAASRQPLFGGLGTDVAGARALYALAAETGAISDAAHGAALAQSLRALQDRGGFTTTLAEVRTRADLIVCIGGLPTRDFPEFFNRCGIEADDARVVMVAGDNASTDLFDTLAWLAALVEAPRAGAPAALVDLSARLTKARYAVIVYMPGTLPAHGALIVEAIGRIVATLNRTTRAAALALGGGDGASTVNQVFTWLSGLPLRSRPGPRGLEHEPLGFDAQRLLADGAVDALLWVSSFGTLPIPAAASGLPRIVLAHPEMAAAEGDAAVFIPVATPGIGSAGHLFRTDGSVLMPLRALRREALPTVADVVERITQALRALRSGRAAHALRSERST
jgi:formylmethanofuran dehydrogenase subunit B